MLRGGLDFSGAPRAFRPGPSLSYRQFQPTCAERRENACFWKTTSPPTFQPVDVLSGLTTSFRAAGLSLKAGADPIEADRVGAPCARVWKECARVRYLLTATEVLA